MAVARLCNIVFQNGAIIVYDMGISAQMVKNIGFSNVFRERFGG